MGQQHALLGWNGGWGASGDFVVPESSGQVGAGWAGKGQKRLGRE